MGNEVSNKKDYNIVLEFIKGKTKDEKEAFNFLLQMSLLSELDKLYDILTPDDTKKMFITIPKHLLMAASSAIKLLTEFA